MLHIDFVGSAGLMFMGLATCVASVLARLLPQSLGNTLGTQMTKLTSQTMKNIVVFA